MSKDCHKLGKAMNCTRMRPVYYYRRSVNEIWYFYSVFESQILQQMFYFKNADQCLSWIENNNYRALTHLILFIVEIHIENYY